MYIKIFAELLNIKIYQTEKMPIKEENKVIFFEKKYLNLDKLKIKSFSKEIEDMEAHEINDDDYLTLNQNKYIDIKKIIYADEELNLNKELYTNIVIEKIDYVSSPILNLDKNIIIKSNITDFDKLTDGFINERLSQDLFLNDKKIELNNSFLKLFKSKENIKKSKTLIMKYCKCSDLYYIEN